MNPDTNNPATFALSGLPQPASETDRNGSQVDIQGRAGDSEEITYYSVPPKRTVTVSVRYRVGGRGQPLPYSLDEEDGQ